MIYEIVWPTAVVLVSLMGWDGFKHWLKRDATSVRELKAELAATQKDWGERFSKYERAHDALVTRFNNTNPSPNPLGKHYSTQRSG